MPARKQPKAAKEMVDVAAPMLLQRHLPPPARQDIPSTITTSSAIHQPELMRYEQRLLYRQCETVEVLAAQPGRRGGQAESAAAEARCRSGGARPPGQRARAPVEKNVCMFQLREGLARAQQRALQVGRRAIQYAAPVPASQRAQKCVAAFLCGRDCPRGQGVGRQCVCARVWSFAVHHCRPSSPLLSGVSYAFACHACFVLRHV